MQHGTPKTNLWLGRVACSVSVGGVVWCIHDVNVKHKVASAIWTTVMAALACCSTETRFLCESDASSITACAFA